MQNKKTLGKIIFFVLLAFAFIPQASYAWLTNYIYKVTVTLSSVTGTTTNAQVKITLDTATLITAGKMQSDCDDIRVLDSDDSTALSYWVEDGTCNTATTRIWVKVPSTGEGDVIYLYYGYASATSSSSVSNAFIKGDDFNDGSIGAMWTQSTPSGGTFTETGGVMKVQRSTTTDSYNQWNGWCSVSAPIIYTSWTYDTEVAQTKQTAFTYYTKY